LSDEEQEERFARAILADNEPHGRAAVGDTVDVFDHRLDLALAAHLDVLKPNARHDASPERIEDRVAVPGLDGRLRHAVTLMRLSGRMSRLMEIGSSPSNRRSSR